MVAQSRRATDFRGPIDERVPGVAAAIDDIVKGFEDPVREPVLSLMNPDVRSQCIWAYRDKSRSSEARRQEVKLLRNAGGRAVRDDG